jgi:hypothetical protein
VDNKLIPLIALVIIVSGCTDLIQTDSSPEGVEPDPGAGLEITKLSAEDTTLRAGQGQLGQRTEITLQLTNHHSKDIDPEISLANTGLLRADDGDTGPDAFDIQCNQDSLAAVQEEIVDQMECTWAVNAPNQSVMGPFGEQSSSMSVVIDYESQIANQEPLTVRFLPRNEIADSNPVERKFSNNEVQMTIRTDNPSAREPEHNRFEISLANAGSGHVGESGYDISYQPDIMVDECPGDNAKGRIGSEFTETCSFDVSSSATRNIFLSAEYKYQKQQNLPITLVQ